METVGSLLKTEQNRTRKSFPYCVCMWCVCIVIKTFITLMILKNIRGNEVDSCSGVTTTRRTWHRQERSDIPSQCQDSSRGSHCHHRQHSTAVLANTYLIVCLVYKLQMDSPIAPHV